jgi:ubiquinone/menaquinone biosynthesis C-methylase UbiE
MTGDALGGFDPKATYDAGALDYEDASRDFWQYLSLRTVDRLSLQPGERVLDVPCGTGPSLIAASARVGPSGRVVGVDYADQMVAIARDKVTALGLGNVEVGTGDMTALARPAVPYDAVICVLGIFFVGDMPGVVRSLVDLVRDGGRVGITVFGEHFCDPMREVFVSVVGDVAPGFDVIEPWRRLDRAAAFEQLFADAGVGDVTIETDDDALPLPSPDDWWRIVMGSGLRRTATALGAEAAVELKVKCAEYIAANNITEVVSRSRYAIITRS